jgi:hypothetical protein
MLLNYKRVKKINYGNLNKFLYNIDCILHLIIKIKGKILKRITLIR